MVTPNTPCPQPYVVPKPGMGGSGVAAGGAFGAAAGGAGGAAGRGEAAAGSAGRAAVLGGVGYDAATVAHCEAVQRAKGRPVPS